MRLDNSLPFILLALISCKEEIKTEKVIAENDSVIVIHTAPDTSTIPNDELGKAIRYGRNLILNTAYYIGPDGVNGKYTGNKMNCTNCHLDVGTRPYALSYFSSHANYPQYRSRENKVLTLADRINNCVMRPHNGKPLPLNSYEMTAILSYIKWVGTGVKTNEHVKGDKPYEFDFPDIAADSKRGEAVYSKYCVSCHAPDGGGKMKEDGVCYQYPPLWGPNSYQPGSSMHRVIKAAQFIYANMPKDSASWDKPKLSVQEALDVAAFINDDKIHSRPQTKSLDYPNPATKPIDYGFGPYVDSFSEMQHKYGPYKPIIDFKKLNNQKVVY